LRERELARRIHVSRTPLREALGRLERDGLAVSKPGLGYFALDLDPKVTEALYEFREVLEVHASRAAAKRISTDGIRELEDIMRELAVYERKKRPSLDQLKEEARLGLRIHEVIASECGNDFIRETLFQLYDRIRLLSWIDFLWFDKRQLKRKEHRDLVGAVTAHDEVRAMRIAQRHVKRCRKDALFVIKAQAREASHVSKSGPVARSR
jgi:DNA-binding GntR family transcriptional regulator